MSFAGRHFDCQRHDGAIHLLGRMGSTPAHPNTNRRTGHQPHLPRAKCALPIFAMGSLSLVGMVPRPTALPVPTATTTSPVLTMPLPSLARKITAPTPRSLTKFTTTPWEQEHRVSKGQNIILPSANCTVLPAARKRPQRRCFIFYSTNPPRNSGF